jgi:hypothetical protein
MNKEEFETTFCSSCGSQRCEGIGTEWFDGCKHKDKFKSMEVNDSNMERIDLCRHCIHNDMCDNYANYTTHCFDYLDSKKVIKVPETGIGDLSDGYHTFNELYHHRAILFSVICSLFPDKAWKSKKHHEGDMFEGMFIVGIDTPEGQATYHYDIDPYWDMFEVKELEIAPRWDGHSAEEAIKRIAVLADKNF